MDTSPEYISMCRKATELQEMWKPKEGDWFYDSVEIRTIGDSFYLGKWNGIHEIYNRPMWNGKDKPLDTTIWLPRIDQLIDMMGNDLRPDEGFTMTIQNRMTTEQELLNEHYKNTCHKSWNGEDWIKL